MLYIRKERVRDKMNKILRFKAIFFDAGGTLVEPYLSVGEIYSEVAGKYGCKISSKEVEQKFREEWEKKDHLTTFRATEGGAGFAGLNHGVNERGWDHHKEGEHHPQEREWWYKLVWDVFETFGGIKKFDVFFDELHDLFARPQVWRVFPEVEGVLKKLKDHGFFLGIVSNWDERLIPLCERLGFGKIFDFILASGLVGSSKPHAGIFKEALRRSGVEPHEALHVGDSIKDDVQGPTRLGIRAVLLDRTGQRKFPIPTVNSLSELIPLVLG